MSRVYLSFCLSPSLSDPQRQEFRVLVSRNCRRVSRVEPVAVWTRGVCSLRPSTSPHPRTWSPAVRQRSFAPFFLAQLCLRTVGRPKRPERERPTTRRDRCARPIVGATDGPTDVRMDGVLLTLSSSLFPAVCLSQSRCAVSTLDVSAVVVDKKCDRCRAPPCPNARSARPGWSALRRRNNSRAQFPQVTPLV